MPYFSGKIKAMKEEQKAKIAEYLYLVFFGITIFIAIRNLTTIKAILPLPSNYQNILYISGVLIVTFKTICDQTWKKWEIIFALIWITTIICISLTYGEPTFVDLTLLMIGAHGTDYRKIVKIHLCISFAFIIILFILSNNGIIQNLISLRNGKDRISFGCGYPTNFAAHLFFMCCEYVWLRDKKISWIELIIILRLGFFCYHYCDSRASFVCFLALTGFMAYIKTWEIIKKGITYEMSKCLRVFCCFSMPLFALLNIGLSYLYTDVSSAMVFLNKLISGRLSLGHTAFERYNITLFGQIIKENNLRGKQEVIGEYYVIDPSYMRLLFKYGLVILLLIVIMTCICCIRESKAGIWPHLIILTLLSVHCFIENHLFQIAYHPFLLLIYAISPECFTALDIKAHGSNFFKKLRFKNEKQNN